MESIWGAGKKAAGSHEDYGRAKRACPTTEYHINASHTRGLSDQRFNEMKGRFANMQENPTWFKTASSVDYFLNRNGHLAGIFPENPGKCDDDL